MLCVLQQSSVCSFFFTFQSPFQLYCIVSCGPFNSYSTHWIILHWVKDTCVRIDIISANASQMQRQHNGQHFPWHQKERWETQRQHRQHRAVCLTSWWCRSFDWILLLSCRQWWQGMNLWNNVAVRFNPISVPCVEGCQPHRKCCLLICLAVVS